MYRDPGLPPRWNADPSVRRAADCELLDAYMDDMRSICAQLRVEQGLPRRQVTLDAAVKKAGKRGNGGKATVDSAAGLALREAQDDLASASKASRNTLTHLPLGDVWSGSRRPETERKLLTHAIGDERLQQRKSPRPAAQFALQPR